MAQMMIDLVNALGGKFRAVSLNLREQRLPGKNLFVELRAGRVEAENLAKRSVVKAVSDLVDVRDRQTGLLQTVTRLPERENRRIACAD